MREVRRLQLIRALPGGYLHPDVADSALPWFDVVCRVHPGAVLIREAARDLAQGLRGGPVPAAIAVAYPNRLVSTGRFVFVPRRLPPERVMSRGTLAWTEPLYTAVELLPSDGGSAACEVLRAGGAERSGELLGEFRTVAAGMSTWPDHAQRTRLLGDLSSAPWSLLELVLHRLLRQNWLTGWSANHRVVLDGSVFYLDVAFPQVKVAVEADGRAHHSDRYAFENDRRRWNALAADGWIVLRVTWDMVNGAPGIVVEQIRSALAGRGAQWV